MRFTITLILLLTALPAMADTLTVSVNRDNGATNTTEPLVLTPANIGAAKAVYVSKYVPSPDGVASNSAALLTAFAALNAGDSLEFESGKTYYLGAGIAPYIPKNVKIHGNGAKIKSEAVGFAMSFGTWQSWTTGLSFTITKNQNHFTIPAGVTLNAGDMFFAKNSTAGGRYSSNTGYYMGVLSNVTRIVGNEAYIDVLPTATFTADTLAVAQSADGLEVSGLTIDNAAATDSASGITIVGRGVKVTGNRVIGAPNAGIGVAVLGIGAEVSSNQIQDYKCLIGDPSGGRFGDGVVAYGHNIKISGNTITNCKHDISLSTGHFISGDIQIVGNTLTQDVADFQQITTLRDATTDGKVHGVIDSHPGTENLLIEGNTIASAGYSGAIYLRNGSAKIKGNRITWLSNTNANGGIVAINEMQLSNLQMSDNEVTAGASATPLFYDYGGSVGAATDAVKLSNNVFTNVVNGGITAPINTAIDNTAYDATAWDGDTTHAPSKNSVRDKIESLASASVDDTAYGIGWNGVTTKAPSQNAVYDKLEAMALANGMIYPGAGIASSTGTAWGTSYTVGTAANNLVQLDGNGKLPAVSGANLTNLPNQLSQSTISITASSTSSTTPVSINVPVSDLSTGTAYSSFSLGVTNNTPSPNASSDWRLINLSPFYSGGGVLPAVEGIFLSPRNTGTGTISQMNGIAFWPRNTSTGTVTSMRSLYLKSPSNTGTVGSMEGIRIENQGLSGVSSTYGILIDDQNTSTNPYAIYTGTGKVRFGDDVQAKTFTPTIPAATTYGATTTLDLAAGDSPSVTLTGNTTLAFSNPKAGQWHRLNLVQDATGSRTVTWPSTGLVCTWRNTAGNAAPTLLTGAGKVDTIVIHTLSTTSAECWTGGNK